MGMKAHGGHLVNRVVSAEQRSSVEKWAHRLPQLVLKARAVSDLLLLGIGAFSPLEGFMGSADYWAVVHEGRLASGLPWTIPITLPVSQEISAEFTGGGGPNEVGLYDETGKLLGTLQVQETYRYDREEEALHVYGTTDVSHPGVSYLRGCENILLGGPITLIDLPSLEPIYEKYFLGPTETRALFEKKQWKPSSPSRHEIRSIAPTSTFSAARSRR